MEIWHRVSFNTLGKEEFFKTAQDLGLVKKTIDSPGGGGKMVYLDVTESDPNWGIVDQLIKTYGAANIYDTLFSNEEVLNAKWLRLIPVFEQGYPQPKAEWPIKQLSYVNVCPECAVYQQTKPFRFAKEPYMGKKSFMSLIWVWQIFCIPEVIASFGEIQTTGYEAWDALIHKTGIPSERVKQIYIPGKTSSGLIIEKNHQRTICPVCGTTKYFPHLKGIMNIKKEAITTNVDFLLTNEWFGHGFFAWREILISNRVARLIIEKGWLGVRLKVVELV